VPIHADHQLVKLIEGFEGGQSRDGLFHPYWDKHRSVLDHRLRPHGARHQNTMR
jgi:hypothetical protein